MPDCGHTKTGNNRQGERPAPGQFHWCSSVTSPLLSFSEFVREVLVHIASKATATARGGCPQHELATATDGVGEQRLIGSGGYGRVYTADALSSLRPEVLPLWLRHKAVAVKRAKSGVHDLADLQREVSVLQQCSHPHVLPLLGYCLEHGAPPCLVFPLMRGGSLADRLWPREADPEHLRRLGLGASLSPLTWHQRLRILRQATDALLYLHTPVPGGKGAVVHRDFKPENNMLDRVLRDSAHLGWRRARACATGRAEHAAMTRQRQRPRTRRRSSSLWVSEGRKRRNRIHVSVRAHL